MEMVGDKGEFRGVGGSVGEQGGVGERRGEGERGLVGQRTYHTSLHISRAVSRETRASMEEMGVFNPFSPLPFSAIPTIYTQCSLIHNEIVKERLKRTNLPPPPPPGPTDMTPVEVLDTYVGGGRWMRGVGGGLAFWDPRRGGSDSLNHRNITGDV